MKKGDKVEIITPFPIEPDVQQQNSRQLNRIEEKLDRLLKYLGADGGMTRGDIAREAQQKVIDIRDRQLTKSKRMLKVKHEREIQRGELVD